MSCHPGPAAIVEPFASSDSGIDSSIVQTSPEEPIEALRERLTFSLRRNLMLDGIDAVRRRASCHSIAFPTAAMQTGATQSKASKPWAEPSSRVVSLPAGRRSHRGPRPAPLCSLLDPVRLRRLGTDCIWQMFPGFRMDGWQRQPVEVCCGW